MHTPPPPPATPPGIHRPAPNQTAPKSAENYGNQRTTHIYKPDLPYYPYATRKVTNPNRFADTRKCAPHTNRLHSRKLAKQRAKRNAKR